ncbi:MAG: DUF2238 domain-containing protein [Gemmatimonadales bacterium]
MDDGESRISPARSSGGLRKHWPVAVFTASYLTVAAAGAILRGNLEFLFYIAVMLVLVGVVLTVHLSVGLSSGALWGLSVWGLLHMAGGLLVVPEGWPVSAESRVLYTLWLIPGRLKYDQVVHAYGFGMTTWVCWQALRSAIRRRGGVAEPGLGVLVLCAAAGMGFGALNEVVEFAATLLIPETNVGGYRNTGWDLVANLIGAATAATWIWLSQRRRVPASDG